jgi:hypothetical protein
MTALRIYEELCGRDFTGKYTIVKDMVRRLRPQRRRQPVLRFETSKGAQAQMDYATYEITLPRRGGASTCSASWVRDGSTTLHGVPGLRDHDS